MVYIKVYDWQSFLAAVRDHSAADQALANDFLSSDERLQPGQAQYTSDTLEIPERDPFEGWQE